MCFANSSLLQRLIDFKLQESLRHHGIFVQNSYDATRNPLDPSIPPRFHVAYIGQQIHGTPSLTFQIAGIWRKNGVLGSIAWVGVMDTCPSLLSHGSPSYWSTTILTVASACLHAKNWAKAHQHSKIQLLTESGELVQHLRSPRLSDVSIRWTLEAILHTAKSFRYCSVRQVSRSEVSQACTITRWWHRHRRRVP